jgi:hypothetical protein
MGDIPFIHVSPQSRSLRMDELLDHWEEEREDDGKDRPTSLAHFFPPQEDEQPQPSSTFSFLDDTDEDVCQQDILARFDMLEHADVSERVVWVSTPIRAIHLPFHP